LGPEGGAAGGELLAQGTPEEVSQKDASYTGVFLRKILNRQQEENSLAVKQSA
jgi:excinuclease ABC subunit A